MLQMLTNTAGVRFFLRNMLNAWHAIKQKHKYLCFDAERTYNYLQLNFR